MLDRMYADCSTGLKQYKKDAAKYGSKTGRI